MSAQSHWAHAVSQLSEGAQRQLELLLQQLERDGGDGGSAGDERGLIRDA